MFAVRLLRPEAQTLLFLLSIAAIVPLAALLSRAAEVLRRTLARLELAKHD